MKYQVHIQWLPCSDAPHKYGIVRVYEEPMGPDVDGLPNKPWVWSCNFILENGIATMYAALDAPPLGSLRNLMDTARHLGATDLLWDRVELNAVRKVRFKL